MKLYETSGWGQGRKHVANRARVLLKMRAPFSLSSRNFRAAELSGTSCLVFSRTLLAEDPCAGRDPWTEGSSCPRGRAPSLDTCLRRYLRNREHAKSSHGLPPGVIERLGASDTNAKRTAALSRRRNSAWVRRACGSFFSYVRPWPPGPSTAWGAFCILRSFVARPWGPRIYEHRPGALPSQGYRTTRPSDATTALLPCQAVPDKPFVRRRWQAVYTRSQGVGIEAG